MENITFTVFNHGQLSLNRLQGLMDEFEHQHQVHVKLEQMPSWEFGWSKMVEFALYHNGPDVSEVGNTWTGDFARMEALRPFSAEEIGRIAQAKDYFENIWGRCKPSTNSQEQVFSIPWSGDVRVIYYFRKDLEKAGVDEAGAFADFSSFETTLARLKESGHPLPLTLPAINTHLTIHNIASWIWGAGGDFLSPDGTRLVFAEPKAMQACQRYFHLRRFLGEETHPSEEIEANNAFWSGKAAVAFDGYWVFSDEVTTPEIRSRLGAAPIPGVPFLGGHDLVIWKHCPHPEAALKLIEFLHSETAAGRLYPWYGLPIRESIWDVPPMNTGFFPVFKASMQKGRRFGGRLWGMVEKRLTDAFSDIWQEIYKEPEERIDRIVETHLEEVANRLHLSMGD